MPNLVTTSFFYGGDLFIPNLQESESTETSERLDEIIRRREEEALLNLLGWPLYDAFVTGIASPTPDAKWTRLRDGATFTFECNGKTITEKFNGLANDEKPEHSPIAYYVWYWYVRKEVSHVTGAGSVATPDSQNAVMDNPARKLTDAYNRFVYLYGDIYDSNYRSAKFFRKHESSHYYHFNEKPSAYNFILANLSDYSGWLFEPMKRINDWNL